MNTTHLPIKITFEQTQKHTKDLVKSHARNHKYYWVWIVFAVVIGLVAILNVTASENPQRMLLSYGVAILLIAIFWYVFMRLIRKRQAKNKELFGHREMIFDLQDIQINTPHSNITYKWDAIVKKTESQLSYFLYITDIQAFIVPKAAFLSEESRAIFEELCELKIGQSEQTLDSLIA